LKTRQHILFKIIALVLLLAVLLPSAVKFAHVLEDHKHEVCIDYSNTHLHEIDLDCEFYKFKINPNVYLLNNNFDLSNIPHFFKSKISSYNFLTYYQQKSEYLRGPPNS